MPIVERFHTLATSYQGFYPSEQELLNKTVYSDSVKLAGDKQNDIGSLPVAPSDIVKPPYVPVMHVESRRQPLGYPGEVIDVPYNGSVQHNRQHHKKNVIVLSEVEFGILCALAGIGIVMLLMPRLNNK